jgi:hypothetical protein
LIAAYKKMQGTEKEHDRNMTGRCRKWKGTRRKNNGK